MNAEDAEARARLYDTKDEFDEPTFSECASILSLGIGIGCGVIFAAIALCCWAVAWLK